MCVMWDLWSCVCPFAKAGFFPGPLSGLTSMPLTASVDCAKSLFDNENEATVSFTARRKKHKNIQKKHKLWIICNCQFHFTTKKLCFLNYIETQLICVLWLTLLQDESVGLQSFA